MLMILYMIAEIHDYVFLMIDIYVSRTETKHKKAAIAIHK